MQPPPSRPPYGVPGPPNLPGPADHPGIAKVLVKPARGAQTQDESTSTCGWDGKVPSSDILTEHVKIELIRSEGTRGVTAAQATQKVFARDAKPEAPGTGFVGKQKAVPGLGDEARLIGDVGRIIDDRIPVLSYTLWIRKENLIAKVTYGPERDDRDGNEDYAAEQAAAVSGELRLGTKLALNLSVLPHSS